MKQKEAIQLIKKFCCHSFYSINTEVINTVIYFMQFLETLNPFQIPEKNHNGSEINAIN